MAMATVGPAATLFSTTTAQRAAAHLDPPSSPPLPPAAYRTPPSIQIELEEAPRTVPPIDGLVIPGHRSFDAAVAPAGLGRFGDAFDLAQRIELTGVIDVAYEDAQVVATAVSLALGPEGKKEKKACTKVSCRGTSGRHDGSREPELTDGERPCVRPARIARRRRGLQRRFEPSRKFPTRWRDDEKRAGPGEVACP